MFDEIIADMPPADRPRERLLKHGPELLSEAELLALVIGSGTAGKNVLQLAREMLREGGLRAIGDHSVRKLARFRGMGEAKATRVLAALELGRRAVSDTPEDPPYVDVELLGPQLVKRYERQTQERLGAVFLDSRDRQVMEREIYIGTVNHAHVSTREIIRYALEDVAVKLILYHNHPSGDPTPSDEDIEFTKRISSSLQLCDTVLIDHLIIGRHRYCSMKTKGLF